MEKKLIKIGDLPIGSIIIDKNSMWEHRTGDGYTGGGEKKPLEWLVVAQDHYRKGETTVLANELIGKYAFDDSTDRGNNNGSNHWGDSGTTNAVVGIRPWLNDIFYNSFGSQFKAAVIETELENKDYKGIAYTTKDKVWIPSQTEMGLKEENTYKVGSDFNYFKNNSSRIAKIGSSNHYYWTRSPHSSYSYSIRSVITDGSSNYHIAHYSRYGVRPALHLKFNNLVRHVKDNIYEFKGVKEWDLPVTFMKRGIVSIQADSIKEAVRIFSENSFLISLPEDSDYIEDSFKIEEMTDS